MNSQSYLKRNSITPDIIEKVRALNQIASDRNLSLAQMALWWVLRQAAVCSVLVGVSRVEQLEENVKLPGQPPLSGEEQQLIEVVLMGRKAG